MPQLVMFSKILGEKSVHEVAETVTGLGLSGIDLTVRPGGHVEPSDVESGLSSAIGVLKQYGLSVPMITTGIVDSQEQHTQNIMAAAAKSEVRLLKLGYWLYEGFGNLAGNIDNAQEALDGIEALAAEYGIKVTLHIHSGNFVTAMPSVVSQLLRNRNPELVGAYVDPCHMTIEGSGSGWKMGLDMLRDRIDITSVKSPGWVWDDDPDTGVRRWLPKIMPLTMGAVLWPEYLGYLAELGFDGPMSIHSEYLGFGSWQDLSVEEAVNQTREDLIYLRGVMDSVGLEVR